MIAILRVRGTVNIRPDIKKTMQSLRLYKPNNLILLKEDKAMMKMVDKSKDYVTFGKIDEKTLTALLEKRGRLEGNKRVDAEYLKEKKISGFDDLAKKLIEGKAHLKDLGIEPVFRLHPPRKGFDRKGIKAPFNLGGALGNRADKINELIGRMI